MDPASKPLQRRSPCSCSCGAFAFERASRGERAARGRYAADADADMGARRPRWRAKRRGHLFAREGRGPMHASHGGKVVTPKVAREGHERCPEHGRARVNGSVLNGSVLSQSDGWQRQSLGRPTPPPPALGRYRLGRLQLRLCPCGPFRQSVAATKQAPAEGALSQCSGTEDQPEHKVGPPG